MCVCVYSVHTYICSSVFSILPLKTCIQESAVQWYYYIYIYIMKKPCCDKEDMRKGAWSEQEDQKLKDYINKHGEGRWRSLPEAAGLLRRGKNCRLRWINYLKPDLKRGNFAEDEEDLIIKLHALLGNRWSLIAGRLPGRTENEVKNYWNSHLRRKLMTMGIDPKNHRLRLPQNYQRGIITSSSTSSSSASTTTPAAGFRPVTLMNSSSGRTCCTCTDVDHVSDAGSCIEEEDHSSPDHLPDLNLDPVPSI